MKLKLIKHSSNHFGFKKLNAYWNNRWGKVLSFAFARYRLLLFY